VAGHCRAIHDASPRRVIRVPLSISAYHSTLPQADRKPGGVEVFVHELSRRLLWRGHHVTVFSFSPRPVDAEYETVALGPPPVGDRTWLRLTAAPLLLNRLNAAGSDVLHLHGDDWFYVRRRRVATVRTFYGSALAEARFATSPLRAATQLMLFPLEILASKLATAAYGFGPGNDRRYNLVGHFDAGVDIPLQRPSQLSEEPSLLFVGTWRGRKRGQALHDWFRRSVQPAIPRAQLWMVSDHCEPTAGVTWFPHPDRSVLNRLYDRAWVLCVPSTYEGFGIPVIEAMARNTAVVASPNRGVLYIAGSPPSALVVGDREMVPALIRLLSNRAMRDEFAARGRNRAYEFTWDRVVAAHEAAYLALLDN
jgi:glycosyltransferase involved in cell wall biosynthesis